MRTRTRLAGLIAPALLGAAIVTVPAAAAGASTHLYAPLGGSTTYPTATGHSDYYGGMGMMGGGREVKVTVSHITRLSGQRVSVFLNGTRVGTMLVSSTGYAYHDWTAGVPYCMGGSRIVVRTSAGTAIAKGTYH